MVQIIELYGANTHWASATRWKKGHNCSILRKWTEIDEQSFACIRLASKWLRPILRVLQIWLTLKFLRDGGVYRRITRTWNALQNTANPIICRWAILCAVMMNARQFFQCGSASFTTSIITPRSKDQRAVLVMVILRASVYTEQTECDMTERNYVLVFTYGQYTSPVSPTPNVIIISNISSNAKTPLAELEKCRKRWVSHFE